ncbi:Hsp70 family protein [Gordonia sp. PP30]|uniref:Hsp70 family protein n=1 Tax=Gordonia sp. PP30 TaxID=2935861 RepID=UPI0024B5B6B7|nr:Hsp70 family protein [Gordonia sp. PP30]
MDLGVRSVVMAVVGENGRPEVVRNRDGSTATPAAALFKDGEILVGLEAKRALAVQPENVVTEVKRRFADPGFVFVRKHSHDRYGADRICAQILRDLA